MGAGKLLWGYHPATKTWIPLQVDANGKVVVDMSAISLGALSDVTIAGLADGHFLSYSAGLGYWQNRLLAEGDIPAAIARDAEVADAVAALATAVADAIAAINLGDLADVSVAAPTNGHVLYWDAGTSLWKAKAVSGAKIQDADGDTSWDTEESADKDEIVGKVKAVEFFRGHDNGIITLAKQPGCKVGLSSDQSLNNETWTHILLDTEEFDIQGEYDNVTNYYFTAKKAGLYLMIGQVLITHTEMVVDKCLSVGIVKNGTDYLSAYYAHSSTVYSLTSAVTLVSFLSASDTIQLNAYHNFGTAKNIRGLTYATNLSIAKIA